MMGKNQDSGSRERLSQVAEAKFDLLDCAKRDTSRNQQCAHTYPHTALL